MMHLVATTPILRRRALYHAALGAAFSLFWTTTPLLLAGPAFHLSQGGIALFALVGVAGAIAAPIAGRIGDRGWTRPATALAMVVAIVAFLITHIAPEGSALSLGLLVVAAILLDAGVTGNMALGQRMIFSLGAESRGRLNGLYMAAFFVGGSIGSALGGWAYAHGEWTLTSWVGMAFPAVALLYFATERKSR
jgi:predicted MFS family arabinose efflux permease